MADFHQRLPNVPEWRQVHRLCRVPAVMLRFDLGRYSMVLLLLIAVIVLSH